MKRITLFLFSVFCFSDSSFSQDLEVEILKVESENLIVLTNQKTEEIIDSIMYLGHDPVWEGQIIQSCIKDPKNLSVLFQNESCFNFYWFQKIGKGWKITGSGMYGCIRRGMITKKEREEWESGGKGLDPYKCNILAPHLLELIYKNKLEEDLSEIIDFSLKENQTVFFEN